MTLIIRGAQSIDALSDAAVCARALGGDDANAVTTGAVFDVIHARRVIEASGGGRLVEDLRTPAEWQAMRGEAERDVRCAFEEARAHRCGDHALKARMALVTLCGLALGQLEALDRGIVPRSPESVSELLMAAREVGRGADMAVIAGEFTSPLEV